MLFLPPVPSAYVAYIEPAPSCPAADIAITSLSVKVTKRGPSDHYVVTGNVQNVGHYTQHPNVQQRVELLRDNKLLVPQTLPPLDADVVYPVSFSLDRPASERGTPLVLTLRYVSVGKASPAQDCSHDNDSLTKTF
jgi:hypothetical protein